MMGTRQSFNCFLPIAFHKIEKIPDGTEKVWQTSQCHLKKWSKIAEKLRRLYNFHQIGGCNNMGTAEHHFVHFLHCVDNNANNLLGQKCSKVET